MKKLLLTFALLGWVQLSFGCDEACKKAEVETAKGIKFASYLDQRYCQSTAQDFLLRARKSLQQYKDNQLATAHRGGAKNIRNFITQRYEWLDECEKYMEAMEMGYIFRKKETTDAIFKSMTDVTAELYKIMMRKKNPNESLPLVTQNAAQKFDVMFKLIDEHVIELQKRGLM